MNDKLSEYIEQRQEEALFRDGNYWAGAAELDEWRKQAEALEQRVEGLEKLQEASIEFYCGVIDKAEWRIAVHNSPKGQELIALAAKKEA